MTMFHNWVSQTTHNNFEYLIANVHNKIMLFSTYLVHKQWTNQPVNNVSTCKVFYSKRNQNLLTRCFEAYNSLMNNKLRILLAQVNPTVGALNKNTDLLLNAYQEAKKDDIDIVAFPEMFLTGYQVQDLILKPSFLKDVSRYLRNDGFRIRSWTW